MVEQFVTLATRRFAHIDPQTGQLLREHVRAPRGWVCIEEADRPGRTPRGILAALARAATAGPSINIVCQTIHRHDGPSGIRRILGVLALANHLFVSSRSIAISSIAPRPSWQDSMVRQAPPVCFECTKALRRRTRRTPDRSHAHGVGWSLR